MELKPEGTCEYCKKSFAGRVMARHLLACVDRKKANTENKGNERIFLIKAGAEPFWVYFEVNASDTLARIDNFLRDLWLECCGHLSMFRINGINYAYDPQPEYEDKSMNIALSKVIIHRMSFSHEYDFGTTTQLNLKCLSERTGNKLKDIEIISQNDMPDFKCTCDKTAKEICTECLWEKGPETLLCKDCAKNHECDEEMFLPVVNSPRMGMCGYTGE